jgi:Na+/phosphate symporter
MKRWILIFFTILAQSILVTAICYAGGTFTQEFRLSVYIPPIIGLNVDSQLKANNALLGTNLGANSTDEVFSNSETNFTSINTVREHQQIVLRTLVVK